MVDLKLKVRNLQNYSIAQTHCLRTEVKHHKKYETLAHNVMK